MYFIRWISVYLCVFTLQVHAANPWLSGTLGAVIPGAGYLANGDSTKAVMGLTTIPGMIIPTMVDGTTNSGRSALLNSFVLSRNVYGFTVYDAFQDALDANGRPNLKVNIPHYTAGQLLAAPFELSNYSAKKVWIPLVVVGSVGALAVIGTRASANATPLDTQKLLFGIPMIAAATLLVGAGEEAEMRGFYYPAFSELTGSVYTGAVLQALLFGYMHTDWFLRGFPMVSGGVLAEINRTKPAQYQGANMVKFIATATSGLLDAWIVSSEENGLLKAVAAHAMWDFLLLTSGLLANNEAPPIVFSMNF